MNPTRLRIAALMILLIGSGLSLPAQAGPLEDARRLADSKKYSQALELIDGVLKETPKEPRARFMKGVILAENRQNTEAIAVFHELTQDYRELPEPYNNLAVLYAEQGDFERAREALMQAIRTHPSYATAHENLGDIYARMASEAYIKALQINRSNSVAQTKLDMIREIFTTPVPAKGKSTTVAQLQPKPAAAEPPKAAEPEAPKTEEAKTEAPKPEPAKAEPPKAEPTPPEPPKAAPQIEPMKAETPRVEPTPKAVDKPAAPVHEEQRQNQEATRLVLDWSKAWSSRDTTTYLGFYAREFTPPRGMSRDEWEKERISRINKPKTIQVTLSNIRTVPSTGDTVEVRFLQEYKSDFYQSRTNKALQLKKDGNRWKIIQELAMDG